MSVIAVGDSITRGLNTNVGALASQSYARWVAAALDEEAVVLADAGITSQQALDRFGDQVVGRHRIGLVFVGANDALAKEWRPEAFRAAHADLLARVADHAEALATLTLPGYMGRWLGKRSVAREANDIIRKNATEAGAWVVDLADLSGTRYVWSDQIHPTSWGQVVIAEKIAETLELGVSPRALADGLMSDPGPEYTGHYLTCGVRYVVRQTATRVARSLGHS